MSQYYQDTLTEEERWQEAEDERLEYEGYCNKIRKGFEDLDEKSGERAIWELVQNVGDQNRELSATVDIIRFFAKAAGHRIWITKLLNPFVWLGSFALQPVNKMFADSYYVPEMSEYGFEYQIVSFEESLERTR